MADRVSATITIGGNVTKNEYDQLTILIANEGLSLDWDSEPFVPDQRVEGKPLQLCAYDVPWGIASGNRRTLADSFLDKVRNIPYILLVKGIPHGR